MFLLLVSSLLPHFPINPKLQNPNPDILAPTMQESSPQSPAKSSSHRRIGIAVDLSDESAFAVKWAVHNYLRPSADSVILLHVSPTSVLYGADWGSVDFSPSPESQTTEESKQKLEDDFNAFTSAKAQDLAQPLVDARINFKIHIVKDHDMKERLCLEAERLGLSAVIMGSRGVGATRRGSKGRLGSVSDYCVHHCVCPVVVVRYLDEGNGGGAAVEVAGHVEEDEDEGEEFRDADDEESKDA